MLFVKDILFLDGAVATFAPDVDLLGEIAVIAAYFATRHGDRIAEEIGIDPRAAAGRPRRRTRVRSASRPTPSASATASSRSGARSCAASSAGTPRVPAPS